MTTQAAAKQGATRELSPWPAILLATLAGAIARAAPVFAAGFPVNDGGLFASMVDDILRRTRLIRGSIRPSPSLRSRQAYADQRSNGCDGSPAASIATIPAFALLAIVLAPTVRGDRHSPSRSCREARMLMMEAGGPRLRCS
jgi:hypothetical protein